jgi:hypothetical protein
MAAAGGGGGAVVVVVGGGAMSTVTVPMLESWLPSVTAKLKWSLVVPSDGAV